jgi:AcrR family transcriptional regulator
VPEAASRQRPGPGRPSSGARERILAAALEVLKADGYAGLTTSKVAARSGENKALIAYHFGSKQGLVAAVAREVSTAITEELLGGIGDPQTAAELARGIVDGLARIMERDEGLARLYFDLASQSIVDEEVGTIMREMKAGYRRVLAELVARVSDGPRRADVDAATILFIAGLEGLALEQLARGETPELIRAREIFVSSVPAVLSAL